MLVTENRITLLLIPGHSGNNGNKISDRLVKLSTRGNFTKHESVVWISTKSVTGEINSWLTENNQKKWDLVSGCKHAKGRELNYNRAREILKLGRNEIKVLTECL